MAVARYRKICLVILMTVDFFCYSIIFCGFQPNCVKEKRILTDLYINPLFQQKGKISHSFFSVGVRAFAIGLSRISSFFSV